MVAETEHSGPVAKPDQARALAHARRWVASLGKFRFRFRFSSLTGRIIFLNVAALILLVSGILYLNQFRAGLIDARVRSLLTQGEIIAGAVAASAANINEPIVIDPNKLLELSTNDPAPAPPTASLDFPLNPERAGQVLRQLISPTKTRAKLFDREGVLSVDSRSLYLHGQLLSNDLPPLEPAERDMLADAWQRVIGWLFRSDLPVYKELEPEDGKGYPEVVAALSGASVSIVRVNERHELIVSVAVPVQHRQSVLAALVLSTLGGDIDAIVQAERWGIVRVFLVALGVTVLLSFLLAGTIAEPVQKLANAAERVRKGIKARVEIPDFTSRNDEIGELSGALRDMTTAMYNRIDAIERFAADVAHELKNPLTSLRSAVETLPLARDQASKERLIEIIQDDVRRLDRLISDISDASRLDAELARSETVPVDVPTLLETVVSVSNETRRDDQPVIALQVAEANGVAHPYRVMGDDNRLGQVVRNLLDNAVSFSPPNSAILVTARRVGKDVEIKVEDEGPGIRPENLTKVFDRFHTDRPGEDTFGKNSGLGLSISRQIVEAHDGKIWAENRLGRINGAGDATGMSGLNGSPFAPAASGESHVLGARFVVRLPAADGAAA